MKAPYISKMTEDPTQPHLGKGTFWKPDAKPLVFGQMPEMPWKKKKRKRKPRKADK